MRVSVAAVRAASLTAAAAAVMVIAVAACGSSTTATTTQAQASGAPPRAVMGDPGNMFTSQLAALVTKGTITAAQQKSIVAALKSSMGSAGPGGAQGGQPSAGSTPGALPSTGATPGAQMQGGQPPDMSSLFTTALDPLVKAGTISAAQEKTVIAALSTRPQGAPTGSRPSGQSGSGSSGGSSSSTI